MSSNVQGVQGSVAAGVVPRRPKYTEIVILRIVALACSCLSLYYAILGVTSRQENTSYPHPLIKTGARVVILVLPCYLIARCLAPRAPVQA